MPARLRCPACGVRYSARASGARCPECGELDGDVREFVRARNPGLSRPIPSHNHWQGQPIDPINGKVRYEGSETLSDGWREFEGDITDPPGHMAGRVLFTRGRLYFFYEAGG